MAKRATAGYRAAATRASRNEEVRGNINPALHSLFNRVGGGRGGLEARTRAFNQYAHDHPREVSAALQAHADRKVSAMVAKGRPDKVPSRRAGSASASSSGGSAGAWSSRYGGASAGTPF